MEEIKANTRRHDGAVLCPSSRFYRDSITRMRPSNLFAAAAAATAEILATFNVNVILPTGGLRALSWDSMERLSY